MVFSERWLSDGMSSLLDLCVLSVGMLVGAFGAGMLPLYITLNQRQLNLFNAFGTGLLLGTAMGVIIPEGVHSLYHSKVEGVHVEQGHEGQDKGWLTPESIIGVALVFGFITMLLVDSISCCGGMHGHSHQSPPGTELTERQRTQSQGADSDIAHDVLESAPLKGQKQSSSRHIPADAAKKRSTVTIGLLVHAFADGMALGAAKASSGPTMGRLEIVVFLAIMMHKMPAAFALSIYLRGSGLDAGGIRKNIGFFALAAPLGAILTFILLDSHFVGIGAVSGSAVAFLLLYSGGTFLYVSSSTLSVNYLEPTTGHWV
eukprot:CAMPEP_0203758224 /NCGR_PEP_ID=MMETSP0098-20131031/10987_1 /ASSEMBLY_ACC=CAM_ASM_000208 /TAXON_ID=96639 /ORGANISM=" , Strain NY0313808BC1" /LENGTH=315 /DNA_ID=CAMNT_0050650527 /DNA_START=126 /DNA_END=1074 /DNA_ORIENTATION=+